MRLCSDPSIDPPYPVYGGIFREEAIMLLRRFYVQENDKAPEPKPKKNRELKTEILPVEVAHSPHVLTPPPQSPTEEKGQAASLAAALEKLKMGDNAKDAAPVKADETKSRIESGTVTKSEVAQPKPEDTRMSTVSNVNVQAKVNGIDDKNSNAKTPLIGAVPAAARVTGVNGKPATNVRSNGASEQINGNDQGTERNA